MPSPGGVSVPSPGGVSVPSPGGVSVPSPGGVLVPSGGVSVPPLDDDGAGTVAVPSGEPLFCIASYVAASI